MNDLYHHGIKGQKWGVKNGPPYPLGDRLPSEPNGASFSKKKQAEYEKKLAIRKAEIKAQYINADGSLTKKGKEVAKKIRDDQTKWNNDHPWASGITSDHQELIKNGVTKVDKNTDLLKKGQILTRYTDKEETIDHKPKYVSLTKTDDSEYKNFAMSGQLGFNGLPVRERYETTKDLKIATPKVVVDYFADKYGDEPIKNFGKYFGENDSGTNTYAKVLKDYDEYLGATFASANGSKTYSQRLVADYIDDGRTRVAWMMNQKVFRDLKTSSEMYEYFREKGYDAIVDIEDYYSNRVQYPLIILDPADSTKKKSSEHDFW